MIAILMGPEARIQARDWAQAGEPPLWLTYVDPKPVPGAITLRGPHYPALAAYAQRMRHPQANPDAMIVTDISAFRTGTPSQRHPVPNDFAHDPDLARISKMVARGLGQYGRMVIHTASALYDQILAEVGTGLGTERKERTLEFGQSLASEAMTHLSWDLNSVGVELILTADDVTVGKRAVPRLPQSTVRMADYLLWCENSTMTYLDGLAGLPDGAVFHWKDTHDYQQEERSGLLRSAVG